MTYSDVKRALDIIPRPIRLVAGAVPLSGRTSDPAQRDYEPDPRLSWPKITTKIIRALTMRPGRLFW